MEIDQFIPLKENETPEHIKSRFNLNHPANLCYLSKSNNQRKSNRLPSAYLEYLETQNETKLHTEFISQTFWNELISESFNGEINNKAAFDSYLTIRGQRLIESLIARVSGVNNEIISHDGNKRTKSLMEINKRYGWISSRTKENKPSDQYQSFFVEIPESVVKESLQNSVDAAVNLQEEYKTLLEYTNEETVKAKIQVISLSKEAKVEWLKAVDYENSLKNIMN